MTTLIRALLMIALGLGIGALMALAGYLEPR